MSSPAVAHPQAGSRPRATRPAILVPFDAREALPLKAAAATANRSQSTIRGWCSLHAIGRRIPFNGPWLISVVALQMLLDGDRRALRAYLEGDRTSELVVRYYRRLGVPLPE